MTTGMTQGMVLFLGMVRRGEFESLQALGLSLGVLVDTNSKQRLGDVSAFAHVDRFNFSRPLPELIEKVRAIQQQHGLSCIFNVIEFYVAQTAEVAAAVGVPGIAPLAARLCLDKSAMRERFHQRIGASAAARFVAVESEAHLLASANTFGYPVFLQPANVSASMWSTRNETPQSLLANYRAMLAEVPAYYARLGQSDKQLVVVLAEYLEGINTSVDCLIDREAKVYTTPPVDVLTGRDVGIDDFHHFARLLPSQVDADKQQELESLAIAGVLALDMTCSAAHVEFIGPRLGEIAARPGGNRPRLLDLAYGIDTLRGYYQVLSGQIPDLTPTRKRAAAIVTPFAVAEGDLREIRYLDRIPQLPGYLYHEVRAQPGQRVGLSRDGYRAPLYIELVADDEDLVRSSVDEIARWTDLYQVD